jgi:hypothetical protein
MRKVTFRLVAIAGFLLTSSGAIAPPAAAEDYVFTVPIDLHGIAAALHKGRIDCTVLTEVPSPAPGLASGAILGRGSASFPLIDGGYHGNVMVKFNATGPLANGKGYLCRLFFLNVTDSDVPAMVEPHRPGTPFTVDVRGALYP